MLTGNVSEDFEMFIEQCEMKSHEAHNTIDDLVALADEFRKSIKDYPTVNYLFWKFAKSLSVKKFTRERPIKYLVCVFSPKYNYVYQLIKNGVVVYVGKTDDVVNRIISHRKDKDFDEVKYYICRDKHEQNLVENTCIFKLTPTLNKGLNLKYVDKNLDIDVFKKSDEILPDFINISGGVGSIKVNEDYYYFNHIGFLKKSVLGVVPHWCKLGTEE